MFTSFGIRFLISNITISLLFLIILFVKRAFKKHITLRMQYNIWSLFLFMLVLPFCPQGSKGLIRINTILSYLDSVAGKNTNTMTGNGTNEAINGGAKWLQDFSVSVNKDTPSPFPIILLIFWLLGAGVMLVLTLRSNLKIKRLISASLPVQNLHVKALYKECLEYTGTKKNIQILSCAYLKSPISIGLLHPRVILPIRLISDLNEKELRFILLHELQHYRYKDISINYFMCLARILYWFHPLVLLALKEMRNDRELACDASVISIIGEDSCEDYGNTLIQFAGKLSGASFPFATGLGGTKKQITKRIISIASFRSDSKWIKIKSALVFSVIVILILSCSPILSVNAASDAVYDFTSQMEASLVDYEDLSSYFKDYGGSFVLYNQNMDNWTIYNKSGSTKRISPESTYKIYSALFGLESSTITPEASTLPWNGKAYSYDSWNQDQTLDSAIENSVNWYFQSLDQKTGMDDLTNYIQLIGYGNENLSGGLGDYWLDSSLKISPVEQVELLAKLCQNTFHFKDSSIQTVKNILLQSENRNGALYGKTGTGNIENKNVNGWFVGFVEKNDNTYYFAVNIQAKDHANGTAARNIALEILKAKQLYSFD